MSRILNHLGSFFPKLQKDFKIYDGEIFSEVYEGDFYKEIPYSKYINENLKLPLDNAVYIRDFGAIPNNTTINNADAINNTIDYCNKNGGGIVVVDDGAYTCGTIYLKSNVVLYIKKDSSIIASHNTDDYTENALIYADSCENIGVVGPGKICGEGNYFSLKPHLPPKTDPFKNTLDVWDLRQEYRKRIRFPYKSKYGYLMFLKSCNRIKLYNLILENSAMWTVNINSSNDVNISNVVLNNNRHVANCDGIDICGSSNVVIKKCFVSTADDGIALKNNMSVTTSGDDGLKIKNNLDVTCKTGMSNIYIHDCEVVSCTNAFKIGTETSLDITDVTVENCKFYLTDIYPAGVSGISIESCDGSKIKNVNISNIQMNSMACPLFIRLCNRNGDKKTELNGKGKIENITVKNIKADNVEIPIMIMGIPNQKIKNVNLENFDVKYADGIDYIDLRFKIPEQEKEYPECNRFRNINAYGLFLRHADNIQVRNVNIKPRKNTLRTYKKIIDCENIKIMKV
jgi:polygalacturonase